MSYVMEDWSGVVLDWVNCLRLTENSVKATQELTDGRFFCEILQLLFRKTVNPKNRGQIFQLLEESLKGYFTPPDWIDFGGAYDGNTDEIVKIIFVLVGVGSLHSEEKIFVENPSEFLNINIQIRLRNFLESVLENGKVVDSRFLLENQNDKENTTKTRTRKLGKYVVPNKTSAPRIPLDPASQDPESSAPPTPHVYVSSPRKDDSPKQPLRGDFLSSPLLEAERLLMSNKNNEITSLRNRIDILTACQRDLMEDITSYKDENSKLTSRNEELDKENQSLKLEFDFHKTISGGTNSPKGPHSPNRADNKADNLHEKLKKTEDYVEDLETRIFEGESKLKEMLEQLAGCKACIRTAAKRESELIKDLEAMEEEKDNLKGILEDKDDNIRRLQQELTDYQDYPPESQSISSDASAHTLFLGSGGCTCKSIREIMASCDDRFNMSQISGLGDGDSGVVFEDLASSVVEVQLRETQEKLESFEFESSNKIQLLESLLTEQNAREDYLKQEHEVLSNELKQAREEFQTIKQILDDQLQETLEKFTSLQIESNETIESLESLLAKRKEREELIVNDLKETKRTLEETEERFKAFEMDAIDRIESLESLLMLFKRNEERMQEEESEEEDDLAEFTATATQNYFNEATTIPNDFKATATTPTTVKSPKKHFSKKIFLLFFLCLLGILCYAIPPPIISIGAELILGHFDLDFSHFAAQHGQLEHISRPII